MRQRCRPGQPKPTSIQQQHSGQWAQTTVHSAQSTGSTAAAASWEAQGRAAAIHPWPMPCKPCACVIIVQQITSFVSEVADAGAQVAGVSNSAIASNFSETLRHCTALHCTAAGCCFAVPPSVTLLAVYRTTGGRRRYVGLLLFFATLCHHSPPSFTFLYSHPHSTPAHASAKAVSATVPLVRQEAHAAAAAVARLVLDHVAPGSQPTTD